MACEKRGRPRGASSTSESTNSKLYAAMGALEVGECVYLETDYDKAQRIRSRVTVSDDRKPQFIHCRKFSSALYTAINAVNPTKIAYLIRIERLS